MELRIGPCMFSKRTPYSKFQLYLAETKENISNKFYEYLQELTKEYELQSKNPEKYFEIYDNKLSALKNDNDIVCAFIPEGITEINDYAFSNTKIKQVYLPDSLTKIGQSSFRNCEIKDIALPDSVTNIGNYCFRSCYNLKSVKLSSSLETINKGVFSQCTSLKHIDLPDSIKVISEEAFEDCEELCNIKLSKNLEGIDDGAFSGNYSLSEINLPDSLICIGKSAFYKCKSLREIDIPNSVKAIGAYAFYKCQWLTSIHLSNNLISLERGVFSYCPSLKDITLPDNISRIFDMAFEDTSNITNINIPKNLNSIQLPIFTGKNKITSLTINHDLCNIETTRPRNIYYHSTSDCDLIGISNIKKLVINNNVNLIDPILFKISGDQIKEIDYVGTKEQFEKFKENNKELFGFFTCLEKINFLDASKKKEEKKVENIR